MKLGISTKPIRPFTPAEIITARIRTAIPPITPIKLVISMVYLSIIKILPLCFRLKF
jgi:hypothetical protein